MSTRSRQAQADEQRRRRNLLIGGALALVVVLVLAVFALSGDDDGTSATEPTATVSMVEMAFVPDPIEVASDDAVLRIVNDGAVAHSMVVPDLGKGTELQPDQEIVLDLTDAKPGEYYAFCDIAGHREAGMETTVVISAD